MTSWANCQWNLGPRPCRPPTAPTAHCQKDLRGTAEPAGVGSGHCPRRQGWESRAPGWEGRAGAHGRLAEGTNRAPPEPGEGGGHRHGLHSASRFLAASQKVNRDRYKFPVFYFPHGDPVTGSKCHHHESLRPCFPTPGQASADLIPAPSEPGSLTEGRLGLPQDKATIPKSALVWRPFCTPQLRTAPRLRAPGGPESSAKISHRQASATTASIPSRGSRLPRPGCPWLAACKAPTAGPWRVLGRNQGASTGRPDMILLFLPSRAPKTFVTLCPPEGSCQEGTGF